MDQIPVFLNCPRCGDRGYERLKSYSHCVACLYSPVFDEEPDVPEWAIKCVKETARKLSQAQQLREERKPPQQPTKHREFAPQTFKSDSATVHVFNIL